MNIVKDSVVSWVLLVEYSSHVVCCLEVPTVHVYCMALISIFSHMRSRVMCLVASVHICVFLTFPSDVVTLAL